MSRVLFFFFFHFSLGHFQDSGLQNDCFPSTNTTVEDSLQSDTDTVTAFTVEMLITYLSSHDSQSHLYLCLYLTIYMARGH